MADSFFKKLKKGMGIETAVEEKIKTPAEEKKPRKKTKKLEIEVKEKEIVPEIKETSILSAPSKTVVEKKVEENRGKWFQGEGELATDVYQTENDFVIQSAIAGVKPEDLDISIEGDVITIRGERKKPFEETGDYFYQECYWGPFSRQIILPVEIDPTRIEATLKEGILIIRMPKIQREKKRKIAIRG